MWEWHLLHHGDKLMEILTHFQDEMEQTKLHSAQLVDVEVSIYPFFLNKKTQMTMGMRWQRNSKGKTIPQGYLRCPSVQSLSDTRQLAVTHQRCY